MKGTLLLIIPELLSMLLCFDTVKTNARKACSHRIKTRQFNGIGGLYLVEIHGGRDRTRTCDLLRVNLSVLPYITDSFSGLHTPLGPVCVSTALIEQHSEQQFACRAEAPQDGVGLRSTMVILPR